MVTHHRGAYLNAVSQIISWGMPAHSVYLWTLPMFHCNGWCFPWAMAANAGTNICLRRVDAKLIFEAIEEHHVTHMCGAPIVYNMLINAPAELQGKSRRKVCGYIAGAAPPASTIEGAERIGFEITHVYGLTETYGPAAICAPQDEWGSLPLAERARLKARQGVASPMQEAMTVRDPVTMETVPADGESIGEIMFRGNIVMNGYLKNPSSTDEAFAGGWLHTGDLAVVEPDGYVRIKDRSKDVIISGGENISSIEVEDVLHRHPAVDTAAVVAKPDPKWGEVPCAFIELKPNMTVSEAEIRQFCRDQMAGYKVPEARGFRTDAEKRHRQGAESSPARTHQDHGRGRGMTYVAPLDEMRFVLDHLAGLPEIATLPGYEDAQPDVVEAILTEAGSFRRRSAGAAERDRRPPGLPLGGRTRHDPRWLPAGLPAVRRRRLARHAGQPRHRRPGNAGAAVERRGRNVEIREPRLLALPDADHRRGRGAGASRVE